MYASLADKPVYLGAQAHLQNFYQSFGFIPVTEVYEEDGIPHIDGTRGNSGVINNPCL